MVSTAFTTPPPAKWCLIPIVIPCIINSTVMLPYLGHVDVSNVNSTFCYRIAVPTASKKAYRSLLQLGQSYPLHPSPASGRDTPSHQSSLTKELFQLIRCCFRIGNNSHTISYTSAAMLPVFLFAKPILGGFRDRKYDAFPEFGGTSQMNLPASLQVHKP